MNLSNAITKLNSLNKERDKLNDLLGKAKTERLKLDYKGHQACIRLVFSDQYNSESGFSLNLDDRDPRSYLNVPKKEFDMVILSLKKMYNKRIEDLQNELEQINREIGSLIGGWK